MSSAGEARSDVLIVLIAEDEVPIAEVVASVVADAGYMPMVAPNGRQALELARRHHPALVITDWMMPHVTGADLIATLRAEEAASGRAAVPVILMTAASVARARAVQADAVLCKPFDLAQLDDLLRRFLRPVA